ncbi:MAG TPA: proline--tRNA ligase [Candidatus Bathyarchaeota archaeon]|nr:proline--tRNA ligase [Candidatus Bathyarchaeota archaeon]
MAVKRQKWSKNFGEWFRDVLIKAGIMDYRYPIKGCGVWMPYGFKIRRNILQILRDLLDNAGHDETLFPLLIPETSLAQESAHVKSFEGECFWVTHGGFEPLKVRYALRPTSETVIAPMLKLWIRSHADLPLKMYQVVNVFRHETKATRPILRMREVEPFKEAHTCHATSEEAEKQVQEAVELYKRFFDEVGVPYVVSRRPDWDKFAGALYTIAFDMLCPDGRTLQIGTVHNLGQNFAKAFDITYETLDGGQEHIWTTSYGISGRGIAAVLIVHGDDNGIVLPPKIAPVQVAVVPVPYKGKEEQINEACRTVAAKLKDVGYRVELDLRDGLTPGNKFYYWELRGVPIRIEIGPRDLANGVVTVVRRDTLKKQTWKMDDAASAVQKFAEEMTRDLKANAAAWMNEHICRVDSLSEAKSLLQKRAGIVEVPWCGKDECGHSLEETVEARLLGFPEDTTEKVDGNCLVCGENAVNVVRVALAY